MTKADNNTVLPKVCILKVLLPKYGHWILYYDGKYYDPEFGLMDELYHKQGFNPIWRFLLMKKNMELVEMNYMKKCNLKGYMEDVIFIH